MDTWKRMPKRNIKYVHRCIYIYVCVCVCVCLYVCMCVFVYVCIMYACMHAYIHTYIHEFCPSILDTPSSSLSVCVYIYMSSSSSSSSVICQTTGPKPLPKRFLHIVRPTASSFNWQYPLLSLRSSSRFLRILSRLLVTHICPFIFPSITCFRRQFLRKMWPIQLAFRFLISCRIFLCSLTPSNTSSFLTSRKLM